MRFTIEKMCHFIDFSGKSSHNLSNPKRSDKSKMSNKGMTRYQVLIREMCNLYLEIAVRFNRIATLRP